MSQFIMCRTMSSSISASVERFDRHFVAAVLVLFTNLYAHAQDGFILSFTISPFSLPLRIGCTFFGICAFFFFAVIHKNTQYCCCFGLVGWSVFYLSLFDSNGPKLCYASDRIVTLNTYLLLFLSHLEQKYFNHMPHGESTCLRAT